MNIIDLKENIEFNSYDIVQQAGVLAKEFTLMTPELDVPYKVGDQLDVNIMGVDEKIDIAGIRQSANEGGWATEIHGFGEGYELMTKCPKKTLSYISMTEDEYDDFMFEFGGSLGKTVDYLEYIPLVRTSDEYGCGGWTSVDIMTDLAVRMGLSLETNINSYDVRQYSSNAGMPFIEAIAGLVSMFDPIVVLVEDIIFVIDGTDLGASVIGGAYEPYKCNVISQEIIVGQPSDQLIVKGVLGEFLADKYRGYAKNTELFQTILGDAIQLQFTYYGVPRNDSSGYGEQDYGSINYDRWVARDVHGNDSFQYYEKRMTIESKWFTEGDYIGYPYYMKIGASNYYTLVTLEDEGFNAYRNTHYKYSQPIQDWEYIVLSGMVWRPPDQGELLHADLGFYAWEWAHTWDMINYFYSASGELIRVDKVRYALCLSDYDGEFGSFVTPLTQLGRDDSMGYVIGEDVWVNYYMTEWNSRVQIALSRETYGMVTMSQRLKGLRTDEVTGDAILDYAIDMPKITSVQAGGHQGNAVELRKMETYYATGLTGVGDPEAADEVLNAGSKSISVNSPNWEHLRQIHERIAMFDGYKKIIREYQMPLMYPLAVGLPVAISDIPVGKDCTLPAPGDVLNDSGIIVGYHISKSASNPMGIVQMSVRGCLEN